MVNTTQGPIVIHDVDCGLKYLASSSTWKGDLLHGWTCVPHAWDSRSSPKNKVWEMAAYNGPGGGQIIVLINRVSP